MRAIAPGLAFLTLLVGAGHDTAAQLSPSPAPTNADRLLLLDSSHLAAVRDRSLRNDITLKPALDALEQDAAKALAMSPVSVMDKAVTPPSGDKHDYMSQAPYWWPDPAKPGGRPYVRRDGERNPEISRISDHDNLGRLTNVIPTLGLAFYFTAREDYATQAARLVRVWFIDPATRMNPHLRFSRDSGHHRWAWHRHHRNARPRRSARRRAADRSIARLDRFR
jgi:hypothetical protein